MWFFNSPEIVYGEGALSYLECLPGKRAFIVTDAVLHRLGFTERVASHLRAAGMEVGHFAEVEPEPSLKTVERGAQAIREFGADWIVGLGGGSAMDAAKGMWALYEYPELSPDAISPLIDLCLGAKARLLTIPTTSGTGAEATWALVLTDPCDGRKLGLGTRQTLATLAVVDPCLSAELPASVTADTGMDVLAHAIEGYTSNWHNDFSDGLCLKAAQMVFEFLPRAVANGADSEAREKMANAATIAGLGFGNSMAALAHATGHALGAAFHQPHGRSVGVLLPYTIEYVARGGISRYAEIAHALRLPEDDELVAAAGLASAIRSLAREVGQPTCIADMGLRETDFEAELERLCDLAEMDTQIVISARIPDRAELTDLFRCAFAGTSVEF